MRLIELGKRRPIAAGKAKIEYRNVKDLRQEERYPYRKDSTIILPDYTDLELLQLQDDWNQFLVLIFGGVWFGGTDENPFLVRMDPEVVHNYYNGGPANFYASIIPQQTSALSAVVKTPLIRQGDIFALRMPFGWQELDKAFKIFNGKNLSVKEASDTYLFGTRHTLKGRMLESPMTIYGNNGVSLAEGEIQAPDHHTIVLAKPHALSQTRLLYDPKNAD